MKGTKGNVRAAFLTVVDVLWLWKDGVPVSATAVEILRKTQNQ